jgi:hypothetical protein
MSEQVATNDAALREFQERVVNKLREDIAGMLPDAVLSQLVSKAVDEQFFKPRKILNPNSGWGRTEYIDAPSWFVGEVAKLAEPLIKEQVEQYVEREKETIKKAIDEFLSQQNLLLLTIAAMRAATMQDIFDVANNVLTRMKQNY